MGPKSEIHDRIDHFQRSHIRKLGRSSYGSFLGNQKVNEEIIATK